MNRVALAETGNALALELDELSGKYHVKSDYHEILAWEADILRAKSQDLVENCGVSENLRVSTLISKWDESLSEKSQLLLTRSNNSILNMRQSKIHNKQYCSKSRAKLANFHRCAGYISWKI
ncbi:hypothetical protein ACJJIF_21435 [Microbulbifer sp. SSSA002]|uniref:hypothetical protein n=1 Tax=unclassified Microbulbifer TaxID=2619833 RepID=UPI004039ACED